MALNFPSVFTAGDSLSFVDPLPDYPASDGWTLTYALSNGDQQYQVSGSAQGDDHLVEAPTSSTRAWSPGEYRWQAFISKGADRHTLGRGRVEIRPDFLSSAADPLSHVERTLQALEAMIEGRASSDQQTMTLNGRSLTRMPVEELLKWRSQYKAEALRLKKAERLAQGLGVKNKVMVRF